MTKHEQSFGKRQRPQYTELLIWPPTFNSAMSILSVTPAGPW